MKIVRGKHFSEPPVVRTSCNGSNIYSYGYTYISPAAPDLLDKATREGRAFDRALAVPPKKFDFRMHVK